MSRAKRNSRRPPPGWTIVVQYHAEPPDEFRERTGVHYAADTISESREEAVLAAWDEYEDDIASSRPRCRAPGTPAEPRDPDPSETPP